MTWRTVILTTDAKLSLRMNHLIISNENVTRIPLVELGVLIIENPNIVVTIHLFNALSINKTTVICCDQSHNPCTVSLPVYGHHRQSKHIQQQVTWKDDRKGILWQKIIEHKIRNQAQLLQNSGRSGSEELINFSNQVEWHDETNREGHAAKVYFNRLFGNDFIRGTEDARNWALNYGYAIFHALLARLIVSKGYLTELGIHHINEYNQYNLASDLIEVFRPLVDKYVVQSIQDEFGKEQRRKLVRLLDEKIFIRNGEHFLQQAMQIYIEKCIHYLNNGDEEHLIFPILK